MDPSLKVEIDEAKSLIKRLRCYWAAVADDLGPIIWAQPTNVYRQIWEQEIFAADCHLEQLIDLNRKKACRTSASLNEDSFRLRDNTRPHHLQDQLRTLASSEAQASNKRTLKRKLSRKRAKARRLTETNTSVHQSSSNPLHHLDTNRRSVTKKIETVQNQILALGQELTNNSGRTELHGDPKSADRLFKFGRDEEENQVSSVSTSVDTATSSKPNERPAKFDSDKCDEGAGSYTRKDVNAYSGIHARTFGPSFAGNIGKFSTATKEVSKTGSYLADKFEFQGQGVDDPLLRRT